MSVTSSEIEYARSVLKDRLSEHGFLHSCGVEETSVAMASLYGVDLAAAQLAGLLHDWDRCTPDADLLVAARELDIPVDPVLEAHPHLLHAHTGALRARAYFLTCEHPFDIGDDVEQAIANHTVGVPEMAPLDQIVYCADMVEPSRYFPQIDDLREMIGTVSLDALFRQCYEHTLYFLVTHRRSIHPDTLHVWNALVAQER